MATPRNVCHRCRHKWKVKRGEWSRECPKCGHANVGPTDPAPSILPKLVLVVLILAGGAYYLGLVGSDTVKEAQEAAEKLQAEVEKRTGGGEEAAPTAARGEAPAAKSPRQPPREPSPSPDPAKPQGEAAPSPRPRVEVGSKMGWAVGSAYRVKGKVENTGGAKATEIKVHVIFHDAQDRVLARYEAECESTSLAPGGSARFESAIAGAEAKQVDDFEVQVEFSGD